MQGNATGRLPAPRKHDLNNCYRLTRKRVCSKCNLTGSPFQGPFSPRTALELERVTSLFITLYILPSCAVPLNELESLNVIYL
eukprot:616280-Pelagomonas_calceolata.AAC.2